MLKLLNQGMCETKIKFPNSLLKNIHKIKVRIKINKLETRLNCFINSTFSLGINIIIKIKINSNTIVKSNRLTELVNKFDIYYTLLACTCLKKR